MNDFRRYDGVAETYERVDAPITSVVAADLVALAEAPPGARVLDAGSGTGVAAGSASSSGSVTGGLVVGIDRSVEMLSAGRHARPGLRLAAAEAIQLPFHDQTFDVVLANFVLPEFTRYDTALYDLIRVLRAGGRLVASTWATEEDELSRTWRDLVEEAIGTDMISDAQQQAAPWAERFGDPARFEATLRDAGLHPVHVERRSYRFAMSSDDYVAEQSIGALGRFVRQMLGASETEAFLSGARAAFAKAFGDRIGDSRDVLIAVGTKP